MPLKFWFFFRVFILFQFPRCFGKSIAKLFCSQFCSKRKRTQSDTISTASRILLAEGNTTNLQFTAQFQRSDLLILYPVCVHPSTWVCVCVCMSSFCYSQCVHCVRLSFCIISRTFSQCVYVNLWTYFRYCTNVCLVFLLSPHSLFSQHIATPHPQDVKITDIFHHIFPLKSLFGI